MRTFLMWRAREGSPGVSESQDVAARLERLLSPLFATSLITQVRQNPAMSFVFLELPVRGWKPPFFQEDAEMWAASVEYPIDAAFHLRGRGRQAGEDTTLLALGRALQEDALPWVRDLAPPFSLIWSSPQSGETYIQNDGLGQSQLFEFQNDHVWALTNRISALKALDIELELDTAAWAVRSVLGWFPSNLTGYRHVRFVDPGTQFRIDTGELTRLHHGVLQDWVHPQPMKPDECLELARCSVTRQIEVAMPQWEKPTVGLSGGRDSRAIVASLRAAGARFSARVRGLPNNPNVLVASRLAETAGFTLKVRSGAGLPPDNADACRRTILRALLWQAGYMVTHKHKTFLAERSFLDGGAVNVMGQHGELGRGYYAGRIRAAECDERDYEQRLVDRIFRYGPPFVRDDVRALIRETIAQAYRQADRYHLTGLARLDFFYLFERTRRWASGSLSSQTALVVAPFLNPDYIRAVFAYEGDKQSNPFHQHIIETNAPDWVDIPYADDPIWRQVLAERPSASAGEEGTPDAEWKRPTGHENYNSSLYWEMVGHPVIDEALTGSDWWTEIFDGERAPREWLRAPDILALVALAPHIAGDAFLMLHSSEALR